MITRTTSRLVLRPLVLADALALHEGFSDPDTMRYWSRPPHTTFAETEAWVRASVEAGEAGRSIELAADHQGRFIGRVGFWQGNEVGFLFLRTTWGKGLAREAVGAAIDHAFSVRDWPDIQADVDPRNERCLRLLAALGFRTIGRAPRTYCIAGEWADSVYLTLPRPRVQ